MHFDRAYYEAQVTGSFLAARAILPLLFAEFCPSSIADVGCGTGAWLRAARLLGVHTVLGFDVDDVPADELEIPADRFRAVDLAQQAPSAPHPFDLALCMEMAAQLPAERATSFIFEVAQLADVILFSSAIPHQGGIAHINEQFPSYWISRFQDAGCRCFDFLRPRIWNHADLPVPYRQNVLVFSRSRIFPCEVTDPVAADRVHPDLWVRHNGAFGVLRTAGRALPPALQSRFTALCQRIGHVQLL